MSSGKRPDHRGGCIFAVESSKSLNIYQRKGKGLRSWGGKPKRDEALQYPLSSSETGESNQLWLPNAFKVRKGSVSGKAAFAVRFNAFVVQCHGNPREINILLPWACTCKESFPIAYSMAEPGGKSLGAPPIVLSTTRSVGPMGASNESPPV